MQREIFFKFGVANYTEHDASIEDLCIHSTDYGRDYLKECKKHVMEVSGKLKSELISRSGYVMTQFGENFINDSSLLAVSCICF